MNGVHDNLTAYDNLRCLFRTPESIFDLYYDIRARYDGDSPNIYIICRGAADREYAFDILYRTFLSYITRAIKNQKILTEDKCFHFRIFDENNWSKGIKYNKIYFSEDILAALCEREEYKDGYLG